MRLSSKNKRTKFALQAQKEKGRCVSAAPFSISSWFRAVSGTFSPPIQLRLRALPSSKRVFNGAQV
jgi:hypothetical protein